jgi:hypothetical protein
MCRRTGDIEWRSDAQVATIEVKPNPSRYKMKPDPGPATIYIGSILALMSTKVAAKWLQK